jgi:hypothetical protein
MCSVYYSTILIDDKITDLVFVIFVGRYSAGFPCRPQLKCIPTHASAEKVVACCR